MLLIGIIIDYLDDDNGHGYVNQVVVQMKTTMVDLVLQSAIWMNTVNIDTSISCHLDED